MSRNLVVGLTAAAVLGAGLAGAVQPARAATAPAYASTPPGVVLSASAARAAAVRPNAKIHYLAATHAGATARLQLVDRSTGATLATLASRPMTSTGGSLDNPYDDATIAPDGTVWATQWTGGTYGWSLLRIKDGRVNTFMPYVRSVRVSPDGTRLAVSIVSPDANRDGRGTVSVLVGSATGGTYRTLNEETFPVDKRGEPVGVFRLPLVSTWLGNGALALAYGCCDDGNVSVISATTPSRQSSWPVVNGTAQTDVVAKLGDATAVVPVEAGSGWDILTVTPARPRGTKVAHTGDIARWIRTAGATPMSEYYTTLSYRPVSGVTRDASFIAR